MYSHSDMQFWPTDQINDSDRWHMVVIPALRKQRREDSQLEVSLNYVVIVMLL